MSKVKHTPTPWNEDYIRSIMAAGYTYLTMDGTIPYEAIKQYEPQMNADAKHATKCVNLHNDLVEALRAIHLQALQSSVNDTSNDYGREALDMAYKVLKKAGAL